MRTIEDAWNWYQGTRTQLRLWQRIVKRYWGDLPWEGRLGRDDHFRNLDATQSEAASSMSLQEMDDLGVLVLFSVFESLVRSRLAEEVELQVDRKGIDNSVLLHAAKEAVERLKGGSFHWVLESFKTVDKDLVEEVSQVRRYRNWVAHGRRGATPAVVDPKTAHDRLSRFWQLIQPQLLTAGMTEVR
jgi:hypothetical protein